MSRIVLIDATVDSLTVSWPDLDDGTTTVSSSVSNPKKKNSTHTTTVDYCLQYRRNESSMNDKKIEHSEMYETLSSSLHTTLVRKKNLTDPEHHGFIFRVRTSNRTTTTTSSDNDDHYEWITHTEPFYLLTNEQEESYRRMGPPSVTYGGTNASLRISWNADTTMTTTTPVAEREEASTQPMVSYEIQMRENRGGIPWTTIATMDQSTQVRKKNLTSSLGYQFRIRPTSSSNSRTSATLADGAPIPFSPPSEPFIALSYETNCVGLQRLLAAVTNQVVLSNHHHHSWTNLTGGGRNKHPTIHPVSLPIAETLGGKEFILVYASAHWCGPCRQFTPKLVAWYLQQHQQSVKSATGDMNVSPIEIVFLSADHDEASFRSYYSSMPWTAIDYDDPTREQFLSYIRVTGIPRLTVLDGRTGAIIEDNAVGKPLDIQRWRKLVSKE